MRLGELFELVRDRLSEDRGGVLVTTAVSLALLIGVTILVVDVGHWFQHKRHLQLQADAGALAGAGLFNNCLGDAPTGSFDSDPSGIPGRQIVRPENVEVIAPTPGGAPDAPATGAYLTLTTCHPKYSARQRMIIHARLEGAPLTKASAPDGPPALTG